MYNLGYGCARDHVPWVFPNGDGLTAPALATKQAAATHLGVLKSVEWMTVSKTTTQFEDSVFSVTSIQFCKL
jgi:hypothetical protein